MTAVFIHANGTWQLPQGEGQIPGRVRPRPPFPLPLRSQVTRLSTLPGGCVCWGWGGPSQGTFRVRLFAPSLPVLVLPVGQPLFRNVEVAGVRWALGLHLRGSFSSNLTLLGRACLTRDLSLHQSRVCPPPPSPLPPSLSPTPPRALIAKIRDHSKESCKPGVTSCPHVN